MEKFRKRTCKLPIVEIKNVRNCKYAKYVRWRALACITFYGKRFAHHIRFYWAVFVFRSSVSRFFLHFVTHWCGVRIHSIHIWSSRDAINTKWLIEAICQVRNWWAERFENGFVRLDTARAHAIRRIAHSRSGMSNRVTVGPHDRCTRDRMRAQWLNIGTSGVSGRPTQTWEINVIARFQSSAFFRLLLNILLFPSHAPSPLKRNERRETHNIRTECSFFYFSFRHPASSSCSGKVSKRICAAYSRKFVTF